MIPKFRAWDKTLGIIDIVSIDFNNKTFVGEHWEYGETETIPLDDIILMQSTGLFDKNCVEIFEGDVVEYIDGEFSFIGKVIKSTLGTYVTGIDNHSFEDFTDETTMISDVSVVGNIYENHELLESVEE